MKNCVSSLLLFIACCSLSSCYVTETRYAPRYSNDYVYAAGSFGNGPYWGGGNYWGNRWNRYYTNHFGWRNYWYGRGVAYGNRWHEGRAYPGRWQGRNWGAHPSSRWGGYRR